MTIVMIQGMMEIAPDAVRGFQRIAKKFNVDFAITKDKSKEPPLLQVFFKARDYQLQCRRESDTGTAFVQEKGQSGR